MLIDPYRFGSVVEPEDPFWADTILLLQFSDGQVHERTGTPTSVTVVGNGVVDNSVPIFGEESFSNPGTSTQGLHYIDVLGASGLYVFDGPFTMEGTFHLSFINDTINDFFSNDINYPEQGYYQCFVSGAGFNSRFGINSIHDTLPTETFVFTPVDSSLAFVGTTFHFAVSRDSSDVVRVFLDGVKLGEGSIPYTIGRDVGGVSRFRVGAGNSSLTNNGDFSGAWKDIRVTKACRYTANFTPPSEEFPVG